MPRMSSRPRHRKPSRERLAYATLALALPALIAGILLSPPAQASTGSVSGSVWDDADRDGVRDPGEVGFPGLHFFVTNLDTGSTVTSVSTDSDGRYSASSLPAGRYEVEIVHPDWVAIRDEWVPTTTGSLFFRRQVSVEGSAQLDFGMRRIVRSTEVGTPISRVVGSNGLTVESYNDAVSAQELYDSLMRGHVGAEAPTVTVWFDLVNANVTTSSYSGSEGAYSNYRAKVKVDYLSWLLPYQESVLAHEYGHAWSLFHATMTQQTLSLDGYLAARGLFGDPRVGSSYFWDPREMIAEDYRQLLGSPAARGRALDNPDIPPAADVPGLLEYLRDTFTTPPTTPAPTPAPSPTPTEAPALQVTAVSMNPTPVSKSGTASAAVSRPARATVRIETPSGGFVRTLLSDASVSDALSVTWDRKDSKGRRVPGGVYVLVVAASDGVSSTATAKDFTVK